MTRASRNGWTASKVHAYETSPNEKLAIRAIARRSAAGGGALQARSARADEATGKFGGVFPYSNLMVGEGG